MLSRRGVTNDLQNTPYIVKLKYNDDSEVCYHFSSKTNINKFEEKYINNRINIMYSLQNRFKLLITNDILSDLLLYRKIEHRGCYIKINNEVVECLNNIKLDGVAMIIKSYLE